MRQVIYRRGAGLVLPCIIAIFVAGCAGRSVSSSAQDATLEVQPPPPAAPKQSTAVPQAPPPAKPAESEPPPAPVAESTPPPTESTPPKPVEEARTTEPEVAPAVPEKPPEVAAVAPPPPPSPGGPMSLADVFFDFDVFVLRDDAKPRLEENAALLKTQDGWKLLIEGHCDERGTAAYNLVLGERRAQAARGYLANLGLPASLMKVTSFGKEKPFCTEHSYACWQQNRRAHFVMEK